MSHFKKGDLIPIHDDAETILIVEEHIGSGSQADVYRVWDRTDNQHVAMKHCFGYFANDKSKYHKKIQIMIKHEAPHHRLCWPLKVGRMTSDQCFVFTMPLLDGYRPLTGLVTNQDDATIEQKVQVIYQTAQVIQALQKQGFVFGDISDRNILYRLEADGSVDVRFIDSESLSLGKSLTLGLQGSGKFRAPELLLPDPNRDDGRPERPSTQSDLHALYTLSFQLLLRRHPLDGAQSRTRRSDDYEGFLEFYARNPRFIFDGNSNEPGEHVRKKWEALPQPMQIFFRWAFRQEALKNKYERPSCTEFIRCLKLSYDYI